MKGWLPWALVGLGLVLVFGTGDAVALPVGQRDPQSIFDAVAAVNPAGALDLQPGYLGAGYTWCNKFIERVLLQLGITFPGPPTLVNGQIDYLSAGNDGWYEVNGMFDAQAAALQGQIALATYWNPNPAGHGHIALILPVDGPIVMSAQAGERNWNSAPMLAAFGTLPTRFFVHA